ncbi:unnamed protein product [Schistocephalus solidus]|uniref:XPG_I_2 domain-containing protein n=1 Tax=Schistocephalus solidus TaxID=70667 RepID=A0A183S8N2_SCHSO|nr:unnamed protein product [Schistocephalus solidus]
MGVLSLTRLVGDDCMSFKVKKLHSSTIIINGIEFLHVILKSLNVECESVFGVDHVSVKVAIEEAIRRLKTCELDPIFIVQGLPPRHVNPTPDTRDLSTTDAPKHFLTAHIYTPEFSPLKSIPESSRPLVALAMDSELVRELPSAVGIPSYVPGQSRVESFTKLQRVIDWLQTVDPIQAIKSILECLGNPKHAHNVANSIIDFLPKFLPDFTGASRLLSYLGVTNDNNLVTQTVHLDTEKGFSPLEFFKDVLEILKEGEKYGQPTNSEFTAVSVENSTTFDILELTDIYGELTDLVCLINALLHPVDTNIPTDSKYSDYLSLGMLIPSFHLAHQIALCLRLAGESAKSTLAARFWLPKLFYPSPDPTAAMKLRDAAILFTKLVSALPTTRIKWTPLVFDITDPPALFVSKSQRPSGSINQTQSMNPRQWVRSASFERSHHANVCPPRTATLHDSSNIPRGIRSSMVVNTPMAASNWYTTLTYDSSNLDSSQRRNPGGLNKVRVPDVVCASTPGMSDSRTSHHLPHYKGPTASATAIL